MAGTKDSFSHGKRSSFLCKTFSLFLPCNMAVVRAKPLCRVVFHTSGLLGSYQVLIVLEVVYNFFVSHDQNWVSVNCMAQTINQSTVHEQHQYISVFYFMRYLDFKSFILHCSLQCDYSNQGHPTKFPINLTYKNRGG